MTAKTDLVERLRIEADNLECDIEPDDPNKAIYAAKVAQLRKDAATIERQQEVIEKLVREAYEEGVEDGIEWERDKHSPTPPEWIDSLARVNALASLKDSTDGQR